MWRQEKGITVRGENIPNPVLTFAETNFPKYMLDAFRRNNWTNPTDIQVTQSQSENRNMETFDI